MDRRQFLRLGGAVAATSFVGSSLWSRALAAPAQGGPGPYGPLLAPDGNGIMLPAGFTARVVARAQEKVAGTDHTWHLFPDGGATFRTSGGWIYVSNSELPGSGGVGALRFDLRGNVVDAYPICTGTSLNCAGGRTPWNTWLTCEEFDSGHVWECDPTGRRAQVKLPALGTFKHEAAAVDRRSGVIYLTEDVSDGRFYRFVPARRRDLTAGRLQAAAVGENGAVRWLDVPEPNPSLPGGTPTRYQVEESTPFRGGEGIVYDRGHVYVTTKGDDTIWDYDVQAERIQIAYATDLDPARQLSGVDNVTASRSGDLVVAEDGGNMELVLITPEGVAAPLLRVLDQDGSELAGPAFDPAERRLYFSSQRGGQGGITYEVSGPFRRAVRRPRALPRVFP
ncbi:MAG: alkaline phosphatase PhoX [Thermodesulfobacteriota bacterium]